MRAAFFCLGAVMVNQFFTTDVQIAGMNADSEEQQHFDGGLDERVFLEALVDTTDAILTAVRPDGTLVWVNPAFSRATGYGFQEAVGRKIWTFRPPAQQDMARSLFAEEDTGEEGRRFKSHWLTSDGRTVYLSWTTRNLRNPDGSIHLRLGTAQDVTAERETEKRAEHLSLLLDRSMDAMILISTERRIIYCNEAACKLYRTPRGEMLGQLNQMFIPESEEARMKAFNDEIRRTERPAEIETWRRRGDGILIPVQLRVTPLMDDAGDITAFASVSYDISGKLALEERGREASERAKLLSDLVENLSDPVFHIRPDGTIGYVNSACERIYGYTAEEMLNQPSAMLRPKDMVGLMAKYIREVHESTTPVVVETEALHKDGHRIPMELRSSAVRTADGKLLGISGVVRDMTMQKKLEAELRKAADTDALTGLANRNRFERVADAEVKRANRYGHGLAVLVCDIDHFKVVNDSYGHAAGDTALKHFARIVSDCLRQPIDLLGRIGGEEFAVLLPETGLAGATRVAERIRLALAASTVVHEDKTFGIKVSIGVSLYHDGEKSIEAVVKRADNALYRAKENGRNRVESQPV